MPDKRAFHKAGEEVELQRDGLLWLLNRCLFHPAGYALGIETVGRALVMFGDGSESWRFLEDDSKVTAAEAKARAVLGNETVDAMLDRAGPEQEIQL